MKNYVKSSFIVFVLHDMFYDISIAKTHSLEEDISQAKVGKVRLDRVREPTRVG